jgi:hypothetical protein
MASKEPLLESWQDEKARLSLEDGIERQQQRRVKARNPLSLVGYVILVLIAFGTIRLINVKINHIWPARTQPKYTVHGGDEMILDFKQVRTFFHLLSMLPQNISCFTLLQPIC